jgi:heme-degrading monooxygenase HmoA
MINRIVKLSFNQTYCKEFETNFSDTQKIVLSSEGCRSVQLLKSKEDGIYFTYSIWDHEQSLEMYRNSDTFKKIWLEFKAHFKDKAEAWTTTDISPQN